MGRGDKRTAKGKRFKGSYGNSRPHKLKKNAAVAAAAPVKKAKTKKAAEGKAEKPAKKAAAKKAPKKKAE
jgi:30S ribosomal protein S31